MAQNPLRDALEKVEARTDQADIQTPSHPYYLFTTPCAGAGWVATALRDGGFGFAGDWLNFATRADLMEAYGHRELADYLKRAMANHAGPTGAAGVELPLLQVMYAFNIVNIFEVLGRQATPIYVRRGNLMRQAIAFYIGRDSGVYADADRRHDYALDPASLKYNAPAIKSCAEAIVRDEIMFESLLQRQGFKPLRLDYDALGSEPAPLVANVADWLGLEASGQPEGDPLARPVSHPEMEAWESKIRAEESTWLRQLEGQRPAL